MRAWILYQPQWKRPDGTVIFSSLTPKNRHEKKQYMKIISRMLMICFIIGILTTLYICNFYWQSVVKHLPTPMYFVGIVNFNYKHYFG